MRARKGGHQCPLWVISGHMQCKKPCPLYLSLPQIKSARTDGAVHQAQAALRCARRTGCPCKWAHPCLATNEYAAVTSIPIADQIARDLLPATGRRQLVGNPFRRGLRCDAEPEDLSPAVAHDQQSIEQPKGHGRNHKQVHRRNTIRIIAEERPPALGRMRGVPHNGLAMLICRMNCRISAGTAGRPARDLDFQRQ